MPLDWELRDDLIALGGAASKRIEPEDGARQQETARAIVDALHTQPGIVLADEVGTGKTYVALAVIASVLLAEQGSGRPVVVMMPPGLAVKWPREWDQFRSLCCSGPEAFGWVRARYAHTPAEFFKWIAEGKESRPHLIWMTTGCFSRGLRDPWIKLALIRCARSQTRMDASMKKRLWKWATSLTRLRSQRDLTPDLVERLMVADLDRWRSILHSEGILSEEDADPIPEQLYRHAGRLDFAELGAALRGDSLPGHKGAVSSERIRDARTEFNDACQRVYWQWLKLTDWRAPLLVLDEAHHAKNDQTQLAGLLRSHDAEQLVAVGASAAQRPMLWDKFDRMLFLTATPFQLGHHELIRVLKSFGGAKWSGPRAPIQTREHFFASVNSLEARLDSNRLAAKHLDKLWGQVTWAQLGTAEVAAAVPDAVDVWWRKVSSGTDDPLELELTRSVAECLNTKHTAESDSQQPWASIRTWVIRHNRYRHIRTADGNVVPRRESQPGDAISQPTLPGGVGISRGLAIPHEAALPFLLAARAQGELAGGSSKARAYFAEGLCSSYEAFHHTRERRGDARDVGDDGVEVEMGKKVERERLASIVPVVWYESQIETYVPSLQTEESLRLAHPKLRPVVDRAVSLWATGEKVLLFCFYRETAKALRFHLRREVEAAILSMVATRLGMDARTPSRSVSERIESIARRLSDKGSPFYEALSTTIREILGKPEFASIAHREDRLAAVLMAYLRTPAFIARYLPLEEPAVRAALAEGETRARVARAGADAMAIAFSTVPDQSGVTMTRRVEEFLRFAMELAERAKVDVTADGEEVPTDPLDEYLDAVAVCVEPGALEGDDDEAQRSRTSTSRRTFRILPTVRMVFGDTPRDVRERLMLGFNSPLFPEILISSAVLGEGVDLHRFCRYVIHHDLCWNPSTLEQRTGRLDRIRCKAEWVGKSIVVYEPFLAGSADEKMFRVVRDRERWFQIVMGQKFEFDERTSEELAERVPLPNQLAQDLVFNLARYTPLSSVARRE